MKLPSISIAFVDCVAEVPLSITSWKSFVSAIPPVVTVEEPSKVTVPDREIKVSLLLQLPATLMLRLSVDTSSEPSIILRLPLTSKLASKVIDPDELRVRLK